MRGGILAVIFLVTMCLNAPAWGQGGGSGPPGAPGAQPAPVEGPGPATVPAGQPGALPAPVASVPTSTPSPTPEVAPGPAATPEATPQPGSAAPVPKTLPEAVDGIGVQEGMAKYDTEAVTKELTRRGADVISAWKLAQWWALATAAVYMLVLLIRMLGLLDKLDKRWRAPLALALGLVAGFVSGMAEGLPLMSMVQLMISTGASAVGLQQGIVRGLFGVPSPEEKARTGPS